VPALAGALFVLWRGSGDVFWHDFGLEAWPAFEALTKGDVAGFLQLSPVYAGSMTLRAPLAYAAGALGGDDNWIFRAGAIPSVLALAWLGVALAGKAREHLSDRVSWMLVLLLCAAGPIAWQAFDYGHPEDVLAAAGSVGAVLLARSGRTLLSGALLGVAIASKQWALLAVLPAMLAAPSRDLRMLVPAFAIPVLLVAPVWLADTGGFTQEARGVAASGTQFHPHTILWPLAVPGPDLPNGEPGVVAPSWLSPLPKPLILLAGIAAALAYARIRRGRPSEDALLLLAVVMLMRCVLDPWNLVYYHLPFLLALLAWEVHSRRGPVLTLAATALVWLSFVTYDARSGAGPFLVYSAWSLPLLAGLGARLALGPGALGTLRARARRRVATA
jgi:hypothetical protein